MNRISPEDLPLERRLQIDIYIRLASVALWVFEYLLTLDDKCWPLYEIGGWTAVIAMVATETLLLLRTLTLWHDRMKLRTILIVIYVPVSQQYVLPGNLCFPSPGYYPLDTNYQVLTGPYWAVAIFELAVIWMTIYRGFYDCAHSDPYLGGRLMNALRQGNFFLEKDLKLKPTNPLVLPVISVVNIAFSFYPLLFVSHIQYIQTDSNVFSMAHLARESPSTCVAQTETKAQSLPCPTSSLPQRNIIWVLSLSIPGGRYNVANNLGYKFQLCLCSVLFCFAIRISWPVLLYYYY
ncbi:hypothetical protein BJ138DRAFT_1100683 [Hygrophoropsis aurantiaca]|uniref:Uncharacterized protein n=1 Tax=Hygrophoropsis aurantiaca TaxID=72124 RepID=A0ACB8AEW7_9AGAM|nr:hypothetical protein BJ138DRAFT_1100683 [Hygrophoropsis aurantiaca]